MTQVSAKVGVLVGSDDVVGDGEVIVKSEEAWADGGLLAGVGLFLLLGLTPEEMKSWLSAVHLKLVLESW